VDALLDATERISATLQQRAASEAQEWCASPWRLRACLGALTADVLVLQPGRMDPGGGDKKELLGAITQVRGSASAQTLHGMHPSLPSFAASYLSTSRPAPAPCSC
jgi:hypothetical protein